MRLIYKLLFLFAVSAGMSNICISQNPNWSPPNSGEYSNTASVIALINFNEEVSQNSSNQIAFFVDDELRGLSTPVLIGGSVYLHFITLYSNTSNEAMTGKIYYQATDKVYDIAEDLNFETGGIYGEVDMPMMLNIYEDDIPPLYFTAIPDQQTLQGFPFQDLDMEDYLVQVGNNEIIWSFTPNTDLEVSFTGSVLHVSGTSGFSGLTSLTVRATQIMTPSQISGLQFGAPQMNNSFVETTINYIVSPMYNGPAWNNIPPQSIVKGDQFTPVNLHDYEYQYNGPAIQYDYLPVLNPIKSPEPIPNWTFNEHLEVNMNITIKMNYTPKYQFNHEDDAIAAFVNGELRGVSHRDPASGFHFLTVGGAPNEVDPITLKFYSGQKKKTYSLDSFFDFEAFYILGSLSQPYIIDLSPLLPIVPDFPIPGGIASVPIEIIDTSFVGIEHFKFIAFDPLFPDFLYADTTTSFCIAETIVQLSTLYADFDGDGLGNPNIFIQSCDGVLNYVLNSDDCDDTNTIFCSDAIIVSNEPGLCAAVGVNLDEPSFDDCNVTSVYNDAPLILPKGENTIRWTVEFNYLTSKTCTQVVTVIDDEPPVPEIAGSNIIWDEIGAIIASDGMSDQQFGNSVDISNQWAIVGARNDNELGPSAGAAYLLWNDGTSWSEYSKILASNGLKDDEFGYSVSISGNRVVVGASGADLDGIDKGAAYVFEYDGANWVETEILSASNGSDADFFGTSVSISNDFILVGAIGEDSGSNNSGGAYIFEFKESWIEQALLKADDAESGDEFGNSLSISGPNAVIGARFEDSDGINSGAAYIFEKDPILGSWSQAQKLGANSVGANFELGTCVDISGIHVVVGSPHNNSGGLNAGAVFVFIKNGEDWVQEQLIQSDDILANDEFGTSVSIAANYIAVGSPFKFSEEEEAGAAYVFKYDESSWQQQSTILASDTEMGDLFGFSVAIYGHTMISGAYSKDSTFNDVGKCYVFHLNAALPFNDTECPIEYNPPVANDNCDGEITGVLSSISTYTGYGMYEITWTYTDSSGNSSMQFQFIKTSNDITPPLLMCPAELYLLLDNTGNLEVAIDESLLTPSDNCGMVSLDYFPLAFNCSDIGMNLLTVTATDATGNQTICEIPVTIGESPKIVENLNNDGIGSLRSLIEGSCGGVQSIIYFDPTLNGSIALLPPQILIDRDIEIYGLGKDVIDINANNSMRIFEIDSMATFIVRGLQLSNGQESIDGGALLNNGILKLDDVRFIGNKEDGIPKAFSNTGQILIVNGLVEVRE